MVKTERMVVFIAIFLLIVAPVRSENEISVDIQDSSSSVYNKAERIYELSQSVIDSGRVIEAKKHDAFIITVNGLAYTVLVLNVNESQTEILFPFERATNLSIGDIKAVDIDRDRILDVYFRQDSIENGISRIFIKRYSERDFIPIGNYTELFDVTVELDKNVIYSSRDLLALVRFENFGEGASKIDIVYTIKNANGKELFKGIDTKIVQTEETVFKKFDLLDLPYGKYEMDVDIYYGKNQTAGSSKTFEVVSQTLIERLKTTVFFITILAGLIIGIGLMKKNSRLKKEKEAGIAKSNIVRAKKK